MSALSFYPISALVALLPAAILSWKRPNRDRVMLLLIAVAAAGPTSWAIALMSGGWRTGLAPALWISIAATAVEFLALSLWTREGWRLAPLVLPYLLVLGVLALLLDAPATQALSGTAPEAWLDLHILVSVATYGLVGLAAMASLAVLIQERGLKHRRGGGRGSELLPSLASAERLEIGLLAAAEIVLGLGILTGIAAEWFVSVERTGLGHKAVFSVLAFLVIGGMLAAHRFTGLRGRRAARLALLSWLLLTLAYPGVKLVTDIVLA
ncbi:MAG TPA: cytochrome c biogenesis protein CcsA [Alphaproteobacteria bacterium]|nr:cytochrome c biogenesis protein CcsA [Alphaproteobacteria bacterium]